MSKSSRLVRGVGSNDNKYPANKDGKLVKEYDLWHCMLRRCTEKFWEGYQTYTGTTCSENFKNYNYFYEWCNTQVGFGNTDEKGKVWQLDKDLLVKGNKLYSEDTCVFVPHRLNSLLLKCDTTRGEYPVGVYLEKENNKFRARSKGEGNKRQHLGYFNTPQEAFQAYKTFKEALIKDVANEYKNQLDPRVYEALMNYEVNEND